MPPLVRAAAGACVRAGRFAARLFHRIQEVDLLIYKVDRLGDWLLAEPAIDRLAAAVRSGGGRCLILASEESRVVRRWRPAPCAVEEIRFEPHGRLARAARMLRVIGILARVRCRTLVCLRHAPDPIRDFVLEEADARECRALSWRIVPGPAGAVPHETERHHLLLSGLGLASGSAASLLPAMPRPAGEIAAPVVLAPFSSAPIKEWGIPGWRRVVAELVRWGFTAEVWVGPDQRERAAQWLSALGSPPGVRVRSGRLEELANAVARAPLIVSVDTMAAHLAAACDAPLVALLGGGQFGEFAPWSRSSRQRWIFHPLPCFHCDWRCVRSSVDCLGFIAAEDVLLQVTCVLEAGTDGGKRFGAAALPRLDAGVRGADARECHSSQ